MVHERNLKLAIEVWSDHLVYAVSSRDDHNDCHEKAREAWIRTEYSRIMRVYLIAEYDKQALVPVEPSVVKSDFMDQKQNLYIK